MSELAAPIFKRRATKPSPTRRRPATPPPVSSSDASSSDDEGGAPAKRRKKTGILTSTATTAPKPPALDDLSSTKFTADRKSLITSNNDATKQSNWYDEDSHDRLSSKSLLGSTRACHPTSSSTSAENDGTYKGATGYQSFIPKNPNAPSRTVGPVKAPTNIRTITVTDFAPDVCKDYKQTGFCGFGDSCKFLHAREDYKQGWELDKDWETAGKGKKPGVKKVTKNPDADDDDSDDDAALEGIPFACIICKEPYTNPIITKCGHYFCEKCALQRYKRNPSCAACGAGTGGVFNGAKGLKRLLEKKRERAKRRREKAREEGEEVESESEGEEE